MRKLERKKFDVGFGYLQVWWHIHGEPFGGYLRENFHLGYFPCFRMVKDYLGAKGIKLSQVEGLWG